MAVGKNKRLSKGGKKGSKKKIIDPFTRKEWYHVRAPANFTKREMGITLVNRTQGTKIASEGLKGRVVEMSLGDLSENAQDDFRKFNLIIEDVQGSNCLTNFHGMRFTRDKECQMVKKWHTLVEANVAVKTADGYLLRVFAIGFTRKSPTHQKKTCYAQSAKVRAIRAKMNEVISKEVGGSELKEVVNKLIPDSIAKEMERQCQGIYPLQDVYVRKVKVLRKPKFDLGKLMDMHGDAGKGAVHAAGAADDAGAPVDRPDDYEPPVVANV